MEAGVPEDTVLSAHLYTIYNNGIRARLYVSLKGGNNLTLRWYLNLS